MPRILTDFTGEWLIERQIEQIGAPAARFTGQAVFVRDGADLAYTEVGVLQILGQPPMHATRRYRWDANLNVYFDDGRFFHTVPSNGGATQHWCDPDQYDVSYDFSAWPHWSSTWKVQGPRKNYRMITQYRQA